MIADLIGDLLAGLAPGSKPPDDILSWSKRKRLAYVMVRGLVPLVVVFAVIALAAVCAG